MFRTHADDAAVHIKGEGNTSSDKAISAGTVQQETPVNGELFRGKAGSEIFVLDMVDVARFWSRVEVRDQNLCWPWRFGSNSTGYGEFRLLDGERYLAHRFAYRLANGSLDPELIIRHSCDNSLCCNWAHLEVGTHADNVRDRVNRDRSAKGEQMVDTSSSRKRCDTFVRVGYRLTISLRSMRWIFPQFEIFGRVRHGLTCHETSTV